MSTWTFMNIKGQGHSLTFMQGHSDSTFSNFFCSVTAWPIEAKFHMEPPWDVGNDYNPGIYAEWYIVFVFPLVCSYVRWFVHTSVPGPFMELLRSFTCKQLEWSISHQPLIRKHSYLDHMYAGGSAFILWLLIPGSMPQGGARGQNLGHL